MESSIICHSATPAAVAGRRLVPSHTYGIHHPWISVELFNASTINILMKSRGVRSQFEIPFGFERVEQSFYAIENDPLALVREVGSPRAERDYVLVIYGRFETRAYVHEPRTLADVGDSVLHLRSRSRKKSVAEWAWTTGFVTPAVLITVFLCETWCSTYFLRKPPASERLRFVSGLAQGVIAGGDKLEFLLSPRC